MKKGIKYAILLLIIVFLGYNSVEISKLSNLKASVKVFDAKAFAKDMLTKKLPREAGKVIEYDELIKQLKAAPAEAFAKKGRALTLGSIRFFMVKGIAEITAIDENEVQILTEGNNQPSIAIEYVFGNNLRDASGLIDLSDFDNTGDLNNVSSEINKIVRTEVVPPFRSSAKVGYKVEFLGAIELNEAHLNLNNIEIMPASLKILP